jgi:anti-sigma regulatory factor (Ser/Thr protein kinase)
MVGGLIDQACRDGAPVFVAAPPIQLDALRRRPSLANGSSSHDQVRFVALEGPLLNPALLAQALVDFVDAHPEGPAPVGIGEATHAGRGAEALLECALHDSAFGRLFAHGRPWNLTCPIDIGALPSAAVDRVRRMHGPDGSDEAATTRAAKLTEPDPPPPTCAFDADSAREARSWAVGRGRDEGLTGSSLESLEIVAGELTVNSVIHGGGSGTIRLWSTPDSVVCEVTDNGRLDDPLAGRTRPEPLQIGGRGLWIVNQFCELVQVRNLKEGTVVRAHLARSADGAG